MGDRTRASSSTNERVLEEANGHIVNEQGSWLTPTALADVVGDALTEPSVSGTFPRAPSPPPQSSSRVEVRDVLAALGAVVEALSKGSRSESALSDSVTLSQRDLRAHFEEYIRRVEVDGTLITEGSDDERRLVQHLEEVRSNLALSDEPPPTSPKSRASLSAQLLFDIDRIFERLADSDVGKACSKSSDERHEGRHAASRLRVLSFDGGGVRSLFSLLVLEDLMLRVNKLYSKADPALAPRPLKPSDVFDFMYGSSSGGLIAIMLGRLEMTTTECIDKFVQYAGDIFSHPKLFPLGTSVSLPKYNEKVLNHATRRLVSEFDPSSEENQWRRTLFASSEVRTKIGVVAYDDTKASLHVFRSYDRNSQTLRALIGTPSPSNDRIRSFSTASTHYIWEVARATSAAPYYFAPMIVDGHTYLDGGMVANNPSLVALEEVLAFHPDNAVCLVSIGTGTRGMKIPTTHKDQGDRSSGLGTNTRKYIRIMQRLVTETEVTHEQVVSLTSMTEGKNDYHRFNIEDALKDISFDEWKTRKHSTLKEIKETTRIWVRGSEVDAALQSCALELVKGLRSARDTSNQEQHKKKETPNPGTSNSGDECSVSEVIVPRLVTADDDPTETTSPRGDPDVREESLNESERERARGRMQGARKTAAAPAAAAHPRIFHPGKGLTIFASPANIPGEFVIEYTPQIDLFNVKQKYKVDFSIGVCVPLPRFTGCRFVVPEVTMNLWKRMPLKLNIRRLAGHVRMMFIVGNYSDQDLLRLVAVHDDAFNWDTQTAKPAVTIPFESIARQHTGLARSLSNERSGFVTPTNELRRDSSMSTTRT